MLDQGLVGSEEGRRDIIKRINIESIRMSNLISDILEISKLESRESEERKFINISEIIREAIEAIQSQRLLADVTINMKIPKSVVINANRNHLYELVSNLIENAVKYNKKGGYVNIELKESESDISFGIEDGGIGIPKESQSRIFERFYRVDYGRDRTIGGTGLGLSIVKHIVNCYDGEIFINSEAGVGTKIMITLPK